MSHPDRPDRDVFREHTLADGTRWIDMDRRSGSVARWLMDHPEVPDAAAEAVTAENTRPRSALHAPARVLLLRAMNLSGEAEPADMLSVRTIVLPGMVMTLHVGKVRSLADISSELQAGRGPTTAGGLVAAIASRLADRAEPNIEGLGDELDVLESEALDSAIITRERCATMRRTAAMVRRHFLPQRDALLELCTAPDRWLDEESRVLLHEAASRFSRFVDELDEVRERATFVSDRLAAAEAARMNRTMYALSLVAGVFLPISFVTGLLGMNVGGVPGMGDNTAFFVVCGLLVVVVGLEVAIFRRMRWL